MIVDLHLHTTASDGRCTPGELVDRAAAAGVTVMAATDHDTVAAVAEVQAAAASRGIEAVAGIEITAVEDGRDVHMLGYFFDAEDAALASFLRAQRQARYARIVAIVERLAGFGMPLDLTRVVGDARGQSGRSIGRPLVARAMIEAGYVSDVREAFDRWLGRGGPAFVERPGASPERVIEIVHASGGLISLAHPGRTRIDDRIPALRDAGLDALEVYHPDHDAGLSAQYAAVAERLGLLASGGSDFHAEPGRGIEPGAAVLPPADWERLREARHRHAA